MGRHRYATIWDATDAWFCSDLKATAKSPPTGPRPEGVEARVVTTVKACLRWSGWEASWAFPQTRQQGQLWRRPSLASLGFLARVDGGVLLAGTGLAASAAS